MDGKGSHKPKRRGPAGLSESWNMQVLGTSTGCMEGCGQRRAEEAGCLREAASPVVTPRVTGLGSEPSSEVQLSAELSRTLSVN